MRLGYFPRPYPDELLYSVIARCQTHLGIESPKLILDLLFGNRNTAAVADLPSHLVRFSKIVDKFWSIGPEQIAYDHTLFPLYAPFVPEKRKQFLLGSMLGDSGQSLHVASGFSAGKLMVPSHFRYCHLCLGDMRGQFGEYYWPRTWQVAGVDYCQHHQCQLLLSEASFRAVHRHEYITASPAVCCVNKTEMEPATKAIPPINQFAAELLSLSSFSSPTYWQWTHFYHGIAQEQRAIRGDRQVDHAKLHRAFFDHYLSSALALDRYHLAETSEWLTRLFHKHRKAFGYLQHGLVWQCFRPNQRVADLFDEVSQQPKRRVFHLPAPLNAAPEEIDQKRQQWQSLINRYGNFGIKQVRIRFANALYAWLYRHDRTWLLKINHAWHLKRENHSSTDWKNRDNVLVRKLIDINKLADDDLSSPRRSRAWFLNKLPHCASVEKHLKDLPLCQAFFSRYTESIGEYQIRRLSRQLISDHHNKTAHKRWQLYRLCGLEESRLTWLAREFLMWTECR